MTNKNILFEQKRFLNNEAFKRISGISFSQDILKHLIFQAQNLIGDLNQQWFDLITTFSDNQKSQEDFSKISTPLLKRHFDTLEILSADLKEIFSHDMDVYRRQEAETLKDKPFYALNQSYLNLSNLFCATLTWLTLIQQESAHEA